VAEKPNRVSVDPFAHVLGNRRGATEATLSTDLANLKQEFERVVADRDAVAELNDELSTQIATLEDRTAHQEAMYESSERTILLLVSAEKIMRYRVMLAGLADPVEGNGYPNRAEHQGVWTPRRPYLAFQHVHHPRTYRCYAAPHGGVTAGVRPGEDTLWRLCSDPNACPALQEPHLGSHPSHGYAQRQSQFWWDKHNRRWPLKDLTDPHLAAAIRYLRSEAKRLYTGELATRQENAPCPVWAYRNARDWLNDTPLMRALLAERRWRQRHTVWVPGAKL
jgi:hypothetical protein